MELSTSCNIKSGYATDRGLVRAANEDAVLHFTVEEVTADEPTRVYLVADGMGGHRAGETASSMAVAIAKEIISANPMGDIVDSLGRLFHAINAEVVAAGRSNPQLSGMGTTLTVLVIRGCDAWIGHVGDSRVYRIRSQEIEQLTQDDTLVARMVEQGILTSEEVARHPNRNLLVQAIGGQESLDVQLIGPFSVANNDRFLLCTDGLLEVDEQTIANTISLNDPETACGILVRLANASGGADNTTVQVVHCEQGGDSEGMLN